MKVHNNTTVSSPVRRVRVGTMIVLTVLLSWSTLVTPYRAAAQTTPAPAPEDTIPIFEIEKNTWLAIGETAGINLLIWSYDRFIREGGTNPGFRISLDTWQENINNGFEWDDNNFTTNQFAHPYHGSLYFNAARSNGFGYWESLPFAFGGSLMWEYMMEVHHPAYNDWIATSIGGAALGESLHRLSALIVDNTATGSSRAWQEVGAFLVNPVGGLNRLFRGQMGKVHANPEERYPSAFRSNLEFGARAMSEEGVTDSDTTRAFFRASMVYGNPFEGDLEKPYETFDFNIQVNFNDKKGLGAASIKGLLVGKEVGDSKTSQQVIGAFQHFDYVNNYAYEIGGQSFSGSHLGRFAMGSKSVLATQFHADAVILGASKSDYANFTGRSYGYGPGLGFKLAVGWQRNNRPLLTLGHSSHWLFIVNGDAATHYIAYTYLRANLGIYKDLGLGAEYAVYHAERDYEDFEDVSQVYPEGRLFVTLLNF